MPPLLTLLALLGVVSTPAAIAFGIAWWNARRELEIRREIGHPAFGRQGADSSRLEQAIDAMAIEVERITEGQRFMTRLLAERTAERTTAERTAAERTAAERTARERPVLPGSEPRVITPH